MFGKKNKSQTPGRSSGAGPRLERDLGEASPAGSSFKDAIDDQEDDLPEWTPPEDEEAEKKSADPKAAEEEGGAGASQPQVAQPVVANTAPNNPIAGITAPSRGSAQAGYRPMPRPEAAAPAAAPAGEPRRAAPRASEGGGDDDAAKRLIVGRDIRLAGEITSCRKLVVEGTVEANLTDSETLEVAETGLFRGQARVKRAEIFGTFDGELEVTDLLVLHNKGQLKGKVRYKDIEIERGGRLQCELEELDAETGFAGQQADVAVGGGD